MSMTARSELKEPLFEIGFKAALYGDKAVVLAKEAWIGIDK